MAFGFGFNKQKVLSAAEKFVQQGKLQNAIAEYDKVLKNDAKDLTVNNTIGDLYARLGDSAKAIECFKTVGDAYAAQGFTVKGIAMYKKITKLQPSVDGSLKLAELYTQQGLFNDARAQYLQVAEDFMKNGDLEQAVRLFQKVLEMDPENVPMRIKLAEVYVKLGKKQEAWEIFSAAAEALRARGSLAASEDILKRMLTLDPGNSQVLLLRGRAALESDNPKDAIGYLEKAPDLDSHPEGLRDLLKAYLQIGALAKGVPIAEKLLTVHNDPEGLFLLAEGCARLGEYHEAIEVYTRHADRLLATDSTKLLASLHSMITHVRDDSGALDSLLLLLNKAGESTHVNEVTELLAHSSVKDGNLARARDLYKMLSTTEPQNPLHLQNYQQVVGRMTGGLPALAITAEEGAVIVEELEATAPVIDQSYPDHIAIAVRSAVTDADLFLSYNLPEKAVVPLLGALPQAPRDARLNQRLAALHTRFQRFVEAAVCCRTLESVYHDAGYPDEAMRYGELAERYERNAEAAASLPAKPLPVLLSPASGPVTAAAAAPWPMVAPAVFPRGAAPTELGIQELAVHAPATEAQELSSDVSGGGELSSDFSSDLSSEWEHSLSVDQPALAGELPPTVEGEAHADGSSNPEIAETAEEIRFYLEHFMVDQARAGMEKLESLTSDARILDPLRAAVQAAGQPPAEPEAEITEINADEPTGFEVDLETQHGAAIAASPDLMAGYEHEAPGEVHNQIDQGRLEVAPEAAQAVTEAAAAGELTSLVADLEASLGDSFPQAPATQLPEAKLGNGALPGWPTGVATGPAAASTREVEAEAGGHSEPGIPAAAVAPAVMSAEAASAGIGASGAASVPTMSYSAAPVRPLGAGAQAMHPASSVDLSEMFGELKQELEEEVVAGDDDPETHYNLGVAFREMGLLDEAIAEFQKVCSAIERGKEFGQPVQTYTWLAQCFLDKGVPEAAIRWYEKALKIPGLDDQARLAISYELGSACETASDKPAALRHFTDVYITNIDYRDVAERIQALKS
jgi:tetratricopeptide (TPR) repeat protein